MQLSPYLFFTTTCEQALDFYTAVRVRPDRRDGNPATRREWNARAKRGDARQDHACEV